MTSIIYCHPSASFSEGILTAVAFYLHLFSVTRSLFLSIYNLRSLLARRVFSWFFEFLTLLLAILTWKGGQCSLAALGPEISPCQ